MYYNQSSYYRANPFYKQKYLIDAALKNRSNTDKLVEIPQGENHFENSNRKHFLDLLKKSEIYQNNLFTLPRQMIQNNSIVIQKNYPRNLETKDIEGAVSSTLKSKVVKNKEKASSSRSIESPKNQYFDINNKQHYEKFKKYYEQEKMKQNMINQQQMKQSKELVDLMDKRMNRYLKPNSEQNLSLRIDKNYKNEYSEFKSTLEPKQNSNYFSKKSGSQNKLDQSIINQKPNSNYYLNSSYTIESPPPQLNPIHITNLQSQNINNNHNNFNTISIDNHENDIQSLQKQSPRGKSLDVKQSPRMLKNRRITPTYISSVQHGVNPFNMAAKNLMKN